MEMLRSRLKRAKRERGFTLVETLFSIGILAVGLSAMAALMARTLAGTERSRFLGVATTLASEKLEDLNRWPENDPNVFVPAASSTIGSLTSNVVQTVTSGAITESVGYFDEVFLSSGSGSVSETRTSLDGSGNIQYTTTTHQANGTITTSAASTTPPSTQGTITFQRRWIIEKDQPAAGVRRITVLVTLMNLSVQPAVSFQMSMVRP